MNIFLLFFIFKGQIILLIFSFMFFNMYPYKVRDAAWSAMQDSITIGKIYMAVQYT